MEVKELRREKKPVKKTPSAESKEHDFLPTGTGGIAWKYYQSFFTLVLPWFLIWPVIICGESLVQICMQFPEFWLIEMGKFNETQWISGDQYRKSKNKISEIMNFIRDTHLMLCWS